MPWEIKKDADKFCVYKKDETDPMKCYDNEDEAKKYLAALYANENKSDELVYFGDACKMLEDGKFGGYLIRYAVDTHDLTGDYFAKDSQIEIPDNLPVFYNHGKDVKMGKRIIGRATIKKDDVGFWMEGQIALHDEYEKAVTELIKMGKLGLSSGALSHLVERSPVGDGVFQIKSWVVGEASLTPTPAEPFNQAIELKSLPDVSALPDVRDDPNLSTSNHKENNNMADEVIDVNAAVKAALAEERAQTEAKTARDAELQAAKDEGAKGAVEELKRKGALKVSYHTTKPTSDSDDGVQAFKSWLVTGNVNGELIAPESRWEGKAAYNVTTNASGAGYLVPDPLYNQIISKRSLMSWVRTAPVTSFTTPADHLLVPRESTSATAFVKTEEAASYDENEPTVTQKDLILYKYTKLVKMSEEFVQFEGTNFDAWLTQALARAEAVTENTIYTTGSGSGEPEGIQTNSTAGNTVTTTVVLVAADFPALVGKLGAGYNVASQCGFVMSNATKWYVKGLELSAGGWAFITQPSAGPAGTPGLGAAVGEPGILGYPIYVSDDMPTYASATNKAVLFANMNYYAIVEKPSLLIQRNPYLYMANGQIAIFATMFRGGGTLQTEAVYHMVAK